MIATDNDTLLMEQLCSALDRATMGIREPDFVPLRELMGRHDKECRELLRRWTPYPEALEELLGKSSQS